MLAGTLSEFGLADVFSLLAATRKTGVLNLEGPLSCGRVWIADGALCHAVSDVTRAPLAARLLHAGDATAEQAREVVRAQGSGHVGRLAVVLAELGVGHERVQALLIDQIVDAVFDLTRWPDGTFAFDQTDPSGAEAVVAAEEVLANVTQRLTEWDALRARVPTDDTVLELVSRPASRPEGIVVQPALWELLTLVDGLRPVTELVELTGQGWFVVSRLVAELVESGLVAPVAHVTGVTASQHRRAVIADAEADVLGAAPAADAQVPSPGAGDDVPANTAHANTAHANTAHASTARAETTTGNTAHARTARAETTPAEEAHDETEPAEAAHDEAREEAAAIPPGVLRARPPAGDHETGQPPRDHAAAADGVPVDDTLPATVYEEPPAPVNPAREASEDRRARELAALGLSPRSSAPAEEPDRALSRDSAVNADVLARLINGVKGA